MIHHLALLTLLTASLALAQTSPASTTPAVPTVTVPSPASLAAERELTQRALGFGYGDLNVQATLLVFQRLCCLNWPHGRRAAGVA